jgi:hypothetical protein
MSAFTPFAFQGASSQVRTAYNYITGSGPAVSLAIEAIYNNPSYPYPSVYLDNEDISLATTIYASSTGLALNPNSFYITDLDFCMSNIDQAVYREWNGSTLGAPAGIGSLGFTTRYSASLCSGGSTTLVSYTAGTSPAATGYSKCFLPAGTSVKVSGSTDCYQIIDIHGGYSSGAEPYITNIYTNCAGCP